MKLESKKDMIVGGKVYHVDRDGFVNIPKDALLKDGLVRESEGIEDFEIEISEESLAALGKEQLQAIAAEMDLEFDGRAGEAKLRELILDAAAESDGGLA
jgi:hypothetical protein